MRTCTAFFLVSLAASSAHASLGHWDCNGTYADVTNYYNESTGEGVCLTPNMSYLDDSNPNFADINVRQAAFNAEPNPQTDAFKYSLLPQGPLPGDPGHVASETNIVPELCEATSTASMWRTAHFNKAPNISIILNSWADIYFFAGNPTAGVVQPWYVFAAGTSRDATAKAGFDSAVRSCKSPDTTGTCMTAAQLQGVANIVSYNHDNPNTPLPSYPPGSYYATLDRDAGFGGSRITLASIPLQYGFSANGAELPVSSTWSLPEGWLTYAEVKSMLDNGYSSMISRWQFKVTYDSRGVIADPYSPNGFARQIYFNKLVQGHALTIRGFDSTGGGKKLTVVDPIYASVTTRTVTDVNNETYYRCADGDYRNVHIMDSDGTEITTPYSLVLNGEDGSGNVISGGICGLVGGQTYKPYITAQGMRLDGS